MDAFWVAVGVLVLVAFFLVVFNWLAYQGFREAFGCGGR